MTRSEAILEDLNLYYEPGGKTIQAMQQVAVEAMEWLLQEGYEPIRHTKVKRWGKWNHLVGLRKDDHKKIGTSNELFEIFNNQKP